MEGYGAGKIGGAYDRHAAHHHRLVGLGQFAVATALSRKVDDHRTRHHPLNHIRRHQNGRLLSGNRRRGDHDVTLRHDAGHQLPLLTDELFAHFLGVTALVLRGAGFKLHLNELAAQTFDLLLDRRANVVSFHDRAESLRRRDRLKTGHTRANNKNVRRGDRSSRGHEHREHTRGQMGRQEHSLVSRDRRLRRKHVHALRSSDSWHELQRKGEYVLFREIGDSLRIRERVELRNDALAGFHQLQIAAARFDVGAQTSNLKNDLRLGKQITAIGDDLGTLGFV